MCDGHLELRTLRPRPPTSSLDYFSCDVHTPREGQRRSSWCWSQSLGAIPVSSLNPRPVPQQITSDLPSKPTMTQAPLTIVVTNVWSSTGSLLQLLPASILDLPRTSYQHFRMEVGSSHSSAKTFQSISVLQGEKPKFFHWPAGPSEPGHSLSL